MGRQGFAGWLQGQPCSYRVRLNEILSSCSGCPLSNLAERVGYKLIARISMGQWDIAWEETGDSVAPQRDAEGEVRERSGPLSTPRSNKE